MADSAAPLPSQPSYRQLFGVPGFARLTVGTLLSRTGGQLMEVGIVLFVLQRFHSPALAGLTVFAAIFPGLVVSPIAGAMLDRSGRVRLIVLDHAIGAATFVAVVALDHFGRLSPAILVPLVGVGSLTSMLTAGGIRSLFPILLPRDMWGRGNAVDSSGYTITAIIGPALGGVLVGVLGAPAELLVCSGVFALAAAAFAGLREPPPPGTSPPLLRSAWEALTYIARHPTLRGMAIGLSVANVGQGVLTVGLPVLVLQRLHAGADAVGLLFSLAGVAGVISSLGFGPFYRENRERASIAAGFVLIAAAMALMAFAYGPVPVAIAATLVGLASGPLDVSLFSLRQRRTGRAWLGRVMAVSMSLNFAGAPLGSALGGPILHFSITAAFLLATALVVVGTAMFLFLVPSHDPPEEPEPALAPAS